MEALVQLLLTLGLVILVFLLAFFPPSTTRHSRPAATPTQRTTVVTDPDVARLMLSDHADSFSNRPTAQYPKDFSESHSITSVPYGPKWRALRGNLTADILHPTRLGLLVPLRQEAVDALIARLSTQQATGGEVVVVRDSLHAAVFAMTVRMCFGDGVGERCVRAMEREVIQFISTFVGDSALLAGSSRMTRLLHWRRWLRYSGTFSRVSKIILPVITARQQRRRCTNGGGGTGIRSYVDSLLDLRIPDNHGDDAMAGSKRPLTDKEIVRLVFEFLGANTESTVSCVEWTLAYLVIHPEAQKKLHHEITSVQHGKGMPASEERLHHRLPYLRAVILESLRLHAPVPVIMRDVGADDAAVCGTPAASADGAPVLFVADIREIGRNRKAWTDPDEFCPERFLAGGEAEGVGPVPGPKEIRMVPFGAGRRYCPGVGLGMVHVGCFLAALVRVFEWALPADCDGVDLTEFRALFTLMKTPLRARITPRALAM
ncbi:Cytochrome P450 89A9 [Dichanthelium oligosanthes]|uniref:Cytochrome P450 89A9 n=1 Tax=Dichanthelium oligosanthes TaxID=888268 RepID=A0A1E5VUZ3_9POAL|nr:Cytochrome P450 89A9 [Dichanthelium oligosanthes]